MTSPNRIDPTTPANTQQNERLAPVVSPTGAPVVPPALVPWLTVAVGLASVLPLIPGIPVAVATVCGVVVSIGVVFGIVSPGARKK